MSPDDRRPFRGAPFDRTRNDRPGGSGPERGDRPERPPLDRPGFSAPRPFVRPPTRGGDMPPPDHRVRLRDGDREIEVSGNPAFVRQVLDDLPALMARLRGEAQGRTAISMPAPPQPVPDPAMAAPTAAAEPVVVAEAAPDSANGSTGGNGARRRRGAAPEPESSLEDRIFQVLRGSGRPLAIAAIRQRLDGAEITGQQVRRLLERAGTRVTVSTDRPATYSLR
ncbi:MAG TPA: hypothetical protein VG520_09035 [Candidatus Dormibacteraeota bacterium]|nr:hypothetical protein [Candidatus Dormibacteraeota bacterium]